MASNGADGKSWGEMADATNTPVVEKCPQCGTEIDTSLFSFFAQIHCPECLSKIRVRTKVDHFTLIDKLGQGGMGAVFRARDEYLQREVALKVLRKDISASSEEQKKLSEEARRTASINHPHVIKVFSFGSVGGQFYLAMELVQKGSLDDLMQRRPRVAEIQGLSVAIQIAGGLQAAWEAGLIHRDIKPGNILFVDSSTVKLVDFGLALVMDEVAAQKGEIWGTPYYVAPEKLDGGDEDFRSDIYSLGGSIFHALAGRPPYEAETASMVALKQLKSRPVSLQMYAPDISDETNYVINRMMAKDPAERYQSYAELIEHLDYARQKLLEKIRSKQSDAPVKVERGAKAQRSVIGMIMLGVTVCFLLLGIWGVMNRVKVAEMFGLKGMTEATTVGSGARLAMEKARQLVLGGNLRSGIQVLEPLVESDEVPEPEKSWAALQLGMFLFLQGEEKEGSAVFGRLYEAGLFSDEEKQLGLANFFVEMGRLLSQGRPLMNASLQDFDKDGFGAMAYLLFGVNDWVYGDTASAAESFAEFQKATPVRAYGWIAEYHPMAEELQAGEPVFASLLEAAALAQTTLTIDRGLEMIGEAKRKFATTSILRRQLEVLASKLEAKKASGGEGGGIPGAASGEL